MSLVRPAIAFGELDVAADVPVVQVFLRGCN